MPLSVPLTETLSLPKKHKGYPRGYQELFFWVWVPDFNATVGLTFWVMPTGRKTWISGMYTLTQSSRRVSRSDFVKVGAGHSSRTAQVLWFLSSLYPDPACPSCCLASLQVLTVTGVCGSEWGGSLSATFSVHNSLLVRYWCQGLGVPWRKQVSGSQVNHFLCE